MPSEFTERKFSLNWNWQFKVWWVSSACAGGQISVCHSNLGDRLISFFLGVRWGALWECRFLTCVCMYTYLVLKAAFFNTDCTKFSRTLSKKTTTQKKTHLLSPNGGLSDVPTHLESQGCPLLPLSYSPPPPPPRLFFSGLVFLFFLTCHFFNSFCPFHFPPFSSGIDKLDRMVNDTSMFWPYVLFFW